MQFTKDTSTEQIVAFVRKQIDATRCAIKFGWDVTIAPAKKQRTLAQNNFLMAVMQHIVQFYNDTGFCPVGCTAWAMRTNVQKEYWKSRLGVISTAKLSTKEFGEFIDKIQGTMAAESGGEYELLTPPDEYMEIINREGQ